MNVDGAAAAERISRPPPRIIRVPPPKGPAVSSRVILAVLIGVAVPGLACAIVGFVFLIDGTGPGVELLIGAGGCFFTGGVLAWAFSAHNRRSAKDRRVFLDTLPAGEPDPLAAKLDLMWKAGRGPKFEKMRDILREHAAENPGSAHIVCLGTVQVPERGEFYFEPEIIAPTRFFGRQLIFIPAAAALVAVWLLQKSGIIPGKPINLGSMGYILMMGVGVAAAWFWRSAVRPTYIRMAPGVIQVLECPYCRGKPTIRSYPLAGETIAVVVGAATRGKSHVHALTLMRNEHKDEIPLNRMRNRDQTIERTWQALLSTAPTPPLSDENLVG